MSDWMEWMEWSGVDTPQTVMTTRAPAVLRKGSNFTYDYKPNYQIQTTEEFLHLNYLSYNITSVQSLTYKAGQISLLIFDASQLDDKLAWRIILLLSTALNQDGVIQC